MLGGSGGGFGSFGDAAAEGVPWRSLPLGKSLFNPESGFR